jgi:protein-disulfide isomerase
VDKVSNKNNQVKKQRKLQRDKEKKKRQQTWIIMSTTLVFLIVVALIVSIVFHNKKAQTSQQGTPSSQSQIIQYNNEPSIGKANAPIKLAEFGDYKCMYCRQFELAIFPQLKKDYIDTGKVQFYFMNYPIIAQDSVLAANASETIYEEHPNDFWKFHELLYQNQGDETKPWVTEDVLVKVAKEAVPNLDEKPFRWSLSQATYQDQINRDKQMGQRAGVQGTPSLFVNGQPVGNPLDYNGLKKQLDQALQKAGKSNG